MKQLIFITLFFFTLTTLHAQLTDSSKSSIPDTWKKFNVGLRLGLGVQRSFFSEYGIGLQRYVYEERHGFMVAGYYASYQWIPRTRGEKPVHGIKAGAELVNNGGAGAIEITYLTDGDSTDVMITPKFGFGLGVVNLFYGYNFTTNKYPFPRIGKHQFSLVINTNFFLYHLKHRSPGK